MQFKEVNMVFVDCCKQSLTPLHHPSIHPSSAIVFCTKKERMPNYSIYLLLLCANSILIPVCTSLVFLKDIAAYPAFFKLCFGSLFLSFFRNFCSNFFTRCFAKLKHHRKNRKKFFIPNSVTFWQLTLSAFYTCSDVIVTLSK